MKLTKHEKKVLKFFLRDSRMTDTEIAGELKITNQAVGKIRRKLEEQAIIKKYSVELDFSKLGINVFAMETIIISPKENHQKMLNDFVNVLIAIPYSINICRFPEHNIFKIMYGFRTLEELEDFFRVPLVSRMQLNNESSQKIEIKDSRISIFSHQNLLKNNANDLFNKVIDEF